MCKTKAQEKHHKFDSFAVVHENYAMSIPGVSLKSGVGSTDGATVWPDNVRFNGTMDGAALRAVGGGDGSANVHLTLIHCCAR